MKINPKSEEGAITLIALVSVLFMMSFLMSMYILLANKAQRSSATTAEIARKYNNLDDLESIYANYLPEGDVIPIKTAEQFRQIGTDTTVEIDGKYYEFIEEGYYVLKNDIDLGGYDYNNDAWVSSKQWTPITSDFTGTLDGLGNSIKGLYINNNDDYQGLFGGLVATVKNLNIQDSYVKGDEYVGAVAGYVYPGEGTIKNCYNYSPVKGTSHVGGIAGNLTDDIVKCKNTGSIFGNSNVIGGYFTTTSNTSTSLDDVWTENSTLTQNLRFVSGQDVAIVPKGFKVSVDIFEQTIDDGMVIQDGDENEFVWIPVDIRGNTQAEKEADFETLRKNYADSRYNEPASNAAQWELDEYAAMKASIITYEGFYIGRYEAGVPVEAGSRTGNSGTSTMVVKRDCFPYNIVGWGTSMQDYSTEIIVDGNNKGYGAVYLSKNMYTGSNYGVTSTLCYGAEWDAALNFVYDAGFDVTNSTSWGNYKNHALTITRKEARYSNNGTNWTQVNGSFSKSSGNAYALTTGASDDFKTRNIYDLAGNMHEWVMEASPSGSGIRHLNGGAYTKNGVNEGQAVSDINDGPAQTSTSYGFRVALYIN